MTTMEWLLQLSAALLGLTVAFITIGFLVHMSFSTRPDARMAFLTGLMKGAALEDESPNAWSADPIVQRPLPVPLTSSRLMGVHGCPLDLLKVHRGEELLVAAGVVSWKMEGASPLGTLCPCWPRAGLHQGVMSDSLLLHFPS